MITIEPPSTPSIPAPIRSGLTLTRACLVLLAVGTTLVAQSPATPNSNWRLTWSDEFNGPNGSSPIPPSGSRKPAAKASATTSLRRTPTAP
ncbi:hypothetical protein RBB78_23040 [Tunturiibacter empetritectus]|uniref:hypothetical protein n=1 Tax=Tunturiibacter empetritectus TaxID=3069691 RepID=UPI003D9BBD25